MNYQHHNSHRWQHQSHLSFSLFLSSTCNEFLHLHCQKNLETILSNQSMNPSLIRNPKNPPTIFKGSMPELFHRLRKLIDALRDRYVSNVTWMRDVSPLIKPQNRMPFLYKSKKEFKLQSTDQPGRQPGGEAQRSPIASPSGKPALPLELCKHDDVHVETDLAAQWLLLELPQSQRKKKMMMKKKKKKKNMVVWCLLAVAPLSCPVRPPLQPSPPSLLQSSPLTHSVGLSELWALLVPENGIWMNCGCDEMMVLWMMGGWIIVLCAYT